MGNDSLKKKTVLGLVWSAIDKFSSRGIQFLFSILIARQLLPEDYGAIAIMQVFIALSQTFIDSGFGNALIRKKDRTEADYNTVFYFNIAVAVFCYLLLWAGAPFIARFYKLPELIKITRVVGLTLIINSLVGVQGAHLTAAINFKALAKVSIANSIISGLVALFLAARGFGVWALVFQQVASSVVSAFLTWIQVRWTPKLMFSWKSFKEMFSFGSRLLISSLVNTLYNNIYGLVVGKVYSPADLGEFSKASTFANFPSYNISGIIQGVSFPVLSTIQDDKEKLKGYYRRIIRVTAFAVFPAMVGMAAVADPLIRLALTDKWAGMIIYMQILSIAYMWAPIYAINLNLLKVLGRSDYFLKLMVVKKAIGFTILIITTPLGLVAMCLGNLFNSWTAQYVNTYYTKGLIGHGMMDQMKDIRGSLLLSLSMGVIVYLTTSLISSNLISLIAGITIGAIYYIGMAVLLKFPELKEIMNLKSA